MASDSDKSADFSATESALGYLYQVRLALLLSLRRLAKDDSFTLFFETRDDVVFETSGTPAELLQLKHHCKQAPNLTDASPDLWKTLRVWMEGRASNAIPPDGQLFLVTTSAVGKGSAASKLLAHGRDVAAAVKRLTTTASNSTNNANKAAYELFRGLSDEERTLLLDCVTVMPRAPSVDQTGVELRQELRLTVRRNHVESFLIRLEGWWFDRALRQLVDSSTCPILSNELEAQLDDLREQFKLDALPVDQDILSAEVDADAYESRVFVHQAKLAGVGSPRVLAAIRDYYRAFEQRSRWVREDLLLVGELDDYERLLREEWELEFHRVSDEIGEEAASEVKHAAAQRIYAWMEKSSYAIRQQVKHPSLSRGSLHILADRLQVGWHPDFVARLKHLLQSEAS